MAKDKTIDKSTITKNQELVAVRYVTIHHFLKFQAIKTIP